MSPTKRTMMGIAKLRHWSTRLVENRTTAQLKQSRAGVEYSLSCHVYLERPCSAVVPGHPLTSFPLLNELCHRGKVLREQLFGVSIFVGNVGESVCSYIMN